MTRKVFKNGDSMTFHDDCSGKYKKYVIEFEEPVDIRELIAALFEFCGHKNITVKENPDYRLVADFDRAYAALGLSHFGAKPDPTIVPHIRHHRLAGLVNWGLRQLTENHDMSALLNNAYDAMKPHKDTVGGREKRQALWTKTYQRIGEILGRTGTANNPKSATALNKEEFYG